MSIQYKFEMTYQHDCLDETGGSIAQVKEQNYYDK